MNAGLSCNKCLISRSCCHPHHGYCYTGKALNEKVEGENRGKGGEGRVFWSGQQEPCHEDGEAGASLAREGEASARHAEF